MCGKTKQFELSEFPEIIKWCSKSFLTDSKNSISPSFSFLLYVSVRVGKQRTILGKNVIAKFYEKLRLPLDKTS